ncbi:exported protein of unknown function [Nitrosotalea devaniterrae]|uniref:Uncharacterized protein n=1 Tax=Nitrosotalea devaniterrae TaxID=1078905 RepID=A0A128A3V3_9ARCH|nr:exported protein of unknown function [Candidatus Nitrosotalea devanaterra]
MLKKKEFASSALGLYSYAIEEWGKFLILNDNLKKSNYSVDFKILGKSKKPHDSKFQRGLDDLPRYCKIFTKPIDIEKAIKDGKPIYLGKPSESKDYVHYGLRKKRTLLTHEYSIGNFLINFDTRKECFYVDWNEEIDEWKKPLPVSKKNLQMAIKNFLKHVEYKIDSEK